MGITAHIYAEGMAAQNTTWQTSITKTKMKSVLTPNPSLFAIEYTR